MPHISKKSVSKDLLKELDSYLSSFLEDTGSRTRVLIFKEMLTKTERMMIAKRFGILTLLAKGLSLYKISQLLGISPSTVSRFEVMLDRKLYSQTISWLKKNANNKWITELLGEITSFAFKGKRKSFKQFVDEM